MYRCITMYCLYVGFDYTHIDRVLNPFWTHNFGFKPLLGLEPVKPISPQFPARHSYVCMYVYISHAVVVMPLLVSCTHGLTQIKSQRYTCHLYL